jgi:hypothetical protein
MLRFFRIVLLTLFMLILASPVLAQAEEFRLSVRRDFGYGAGANVRGDFSLTIHGNQDTIRSVTYFIDGETIATLPNAPFRHRFKTQHYPFGWRELWAEVETTDGRSVTTPIVRMNFLSADQQAQSFQNFVLPLLGGILLLSALGIGAQTLLMRGTKKLPPGTPRKYGFKGGTICSRCQRPFAIHFWSVNLIGGYLDRCDYCGKLAFVRPRRRDDLEAAERAELAAAESAESAPTASDDALTAEERLRRQIENSKYQ